MLILYLNVLTTNTCFAGQWLWHHNEEIKGQVVEADTHNPIEGALIIALWKLEDVVNEGPGGYDRVEVVESGKEGNFVFPSWTFFKPWQILYKISNDSPYILIFKPGYKVKFSNKPSREGHPGDISLSEEEKTRIKELKRIDPATLEKIKSDKERMDSLEILKWARFPGKHFSKKQMDIIFNYYEIELNNLSDSFKNKWQIKKNLCDVKDFYVGAKCED